MTKLLALIVTILPCLMSVVAIAQPRRTVESAYEFLASALTNGVAGSLATDSFTEHSPVVPAVIAAQGNGCQLVVRLREPSDRTVRIDWSRVSEIKITGPEVALWGTVEDATGDAFIFFFPSEAIAERAANAIKFIKDSCDPGKGTGF